MRLGSLQLYMLLVGSHVAALLHKQAEDGCPLLVCVLFMTWRST